MATHLSSLTQLLVHLDSTANSGQRLAVARALAREHGAAVTAIYAVTPAPLVLPFSPDGGAAAAAFLEEQEEERRAAARRMFDDLLKTEGPSASWAQATGFPIAGSFARQALHADLLVLGQHDRGDPDARSVPADFVETVLAESGKPALVLPYEPVPPVIGSTVVVAWKPTRESARAVAAALPFLQRASRVHVQSWGKPADDEIAGAQLTLDSYLKLHGVKATWNMERGKEPQAMGELLLSRCADLSADLLVMGCYGHSRAREWVLGGVTRTVLRSMTLPVLMSH